MSGWVRASPVASQLVAAREQLPAGALELASHAAVPVALDAEFLHLLRVNFFLDPPLVVPYEAEAALLLSPLFQEIGEGRYEIDPPLRNPLLSSLVARFGDERLGRVASLLEQWTDQLPGWQAHPELEHAQRLTALSLLDPPRALVWLDQAQAAGARSASLGREWYVAMRDRLAGQLPPNHSLDQRLASALAALDSGGVAAIYELGELALLPGSDLLTISRWLAELADQRSSTGRAAQEVLDTLVRSVPPPPRPATPDAPGDPATVQLTDLLGIDDPTTFDPRPNWDKSTTYPRAPIGQTADGSPLWFDVPGRITGMTGSGKSELLRTTVTALAASVPPETLTFLLVDANGQSTFAPLAPLPHVSGLATGLIEEPALAERLADTLTGELARRRGLGSEAMSSEPALQVVVDEAGELLVAFPALAEVLNEISQDGARLGMHLLLASQRDTLLGLRNLDRSHRIVLRPWTEEGSRAVPGIDDAAALRLPGAGYLRRVGGPTVRFQAGYVSDRLPGPVPGWDHVLGPRLSAPGGRVVDALAARIAQFGAQARQVWLPPLADPPTLEQVLPPVAVDPDRGLTADGARVHFGYLAAPIGIVDLPREQRQEPLVVRLGRDHGPLVILGKPGTGKSTLVCTLLVSLALTHTPDEVQFVCLDFGGGLNRLAGLPHLIELVPATGDVTYRVAAVLDAIHARAAGQDGDLVLVVDGWDESREPEFLAEGLRELVTRAPDHGIQVVLTATRPDDLPTRPRGTDVLELRLGDPSASLVDRYRAARVPLDRPGHGLTQDGHRFLAALPRLDGPATGSRTATRALVARIRQAWPGPMPPPLLARAEPSTYVAITVDLVGLDEPGSYHVQGHLLEIGSDGWRTTSGAAHTYPPDMPLAEAVARQVATVAGVPPETESVRVELFAPVDLMAEASELGFPAVLRSLDRFRYQRWHRAWRRRWERLLNSTDGYVYWHPPERTDRTALEAELLSDQRTVVFVPSEPPETRVGQEQLMAALRAGIPAIIWHRTDPASEAFRSVVQRLISEGPLTELPARVRELQREAHRLPPGEHPDHMGRHLVLLWDNPDRLPETPAEPIRPGSES